MRKLVLSVAALLLASEAMAADYLRGSVYDAPPPPVQATYYNWEGAYIGGQAGYTENYVEYGPGTRSMVATLLRFTTIENEARVSNWSSLPARDGRAASYGGFIGYNTQWGEAVLGFEANYNATSILTATSDAIGRRYMTSDNIRYDGLVESRASMRLTDYGTLRVRAGYAANWIMPYVTAGLAVGRADVSRSVVVSFDRADMSSSPPRSLGPLVYSDTKARNGALTVGYAAGIGVDIGLLPGVFVRGEYEFVQLNTVDGMTARINTFRTAAALKF